MARFSAYFEVEDVYSHALGRVLRELDVVVRLAKDYERGRVEQPADEGLRRLFSGQLSMFRVPDRGSGNPTPLGGMGLGSCANAAGTSTCRPAAATSPTRSGPRTATPNAIGRDDALNAK